MARGEGRRWIQGALALVVWISVGLGAQPVAAAALPWRAVTEPAAAADVTRLDDGSAVVTAWADLVLEIIRSAPGFSPPVTARALGYFGVTLWEALAPGLPGAHSLAGRLNGLDAVPQPAPGQEYAWPLVANAAAAAITRRLFADAGETQRAAIDGLEANVRKRYAGRLPAATIKRSSDYGRKVAAAIYSWSRSDGGQDGDFFNYPADYRPPAGPGLWTPTPPTYRAALQPYWGDNRPLVLATGADCPAPPPAPYSTDPQSSSYREAQEVYDTVRHLTPEQREIALYWADDPNLTSTPPGHFFAIATQLLREQNAGLARAAETYARLGMAVSDAFIACWHTKYQYNRLRPVTYIQQVIDPTWNVGAITDPVLTPPFPEYTSGHATEAGAASTVLSALFGDHFAFVDRTQTRLGFAPRSYASFAAAAEEAAMSRLYGGIHFRSANVNGLAQGRCIGAKVMALPLMNR